MIWFERSKASNAVSFTSLLVVVWVVLLVVLVRWQWLNRDKLSRSANRSVASSLSLVHNAWSACEVGSMSDNKWANTVGRQPRTAEVRGLSPLLSNKYLLA